MGWLQNLIQAILPQPQDPTQDEYARHDANANPVATVLNDENEIAPLRTTRGVETTEDEIARHDANANPVLLLLDENNHIVNARISDFTGGGTNSVPFGNITGNPDTNTALKTKFDTQKSEIEALIPKIHFDCISIDWQTQGSYEVTQNLFGGKYTLRAVLTIDESNQIDRELFLKNNQTNDVYVDLYSYDIVGANPTSGTAGAIRFCNLFSGNQERRTTFRMNQPNGENIGGVFFVDFIITDDTEIYKVSTHWNFNNTLGKQYLTTQTQSKV